MEDSLYETLFELRFAERVLERQARFWRRIDLIFRFFGLLSGTAAFAAITQSNQIFTLTFGILFAVLQTLEYTVTPSEKAAAAAQESKRYAAAIARQQQVTPEELRQDLLDIRVADTVTAFEPLRRLAYNDVATEQGSSDYCFPLNPSMFLMGLFA
jgi:DNA-binding transcriptional regulator YdaS (Cro superfamily)